MSRRKLFALSAIALASATAVAAVAIKMLKKEDGEEKQDDEMHFIKIEDGDTPSYDATNKPQEVQEIAAVYPYLNPDFIENILSKNTEFTSKYEEDMLVTVTHKVTFPQIDERKAFVEIMEVGGYETVVDGDQVTASRKFFTQDGAIVSDILNVANQAQALQGTYVDYEIH